MTDQPEWETEPDHVEFEHAGFKCKIKRMGKIGHLCGYVKIPKDHFCYGKDMTLGNNIGLSVHGGITFSGHFHKTIGPDIFPFKTKKKRLVEVSNEWWIGFDCTHFELGDRCPQHIGNPGFAGGTYRNLAYVRKETKYLAGQLANINPKQGISND